MVKERYISKDNEGREKTKKWGVGAFLGKNNHNKPIPFALTMMSSETAQDMDTLFRNFF
jgi:hypothetical protein